MKYLRVKPGNIIKKLERAIKRHDVDLILRATEESYSSDIDWARHVTDAAARKYTELMHQANLILAYS